MCVVEWSYNCKILMYVFTRNFNDTTLDSVERCSTASVMMCGTHPPYFMLMHSFLIVRVVSKANKRFTLKRS